jgi:hypothetical protein
VALTREQQRAYRAQNRERINAQNRAYLARIRAAAAAGAFAACAGPECRRAALRGDLCMGHYCQMRRAPDRPLRPLRHVSATPQEARTRKKTWPKDHRAQMLAYRKRSHGRGRDGLSDAYVAALLDLNTKTCPTALIEAKREQIRGIRLITDMESTT